MNQDPPVFLRRKQVEAITGTPCSSIYARMHDGLFPTAINIGTRSVAWIASEIYQLNAARISGQSDDQIRQLVLKLKANRNFKKEQA